MQRIGEVAMEIRESSKPRRNSLTVFQHTMEYCVGNYLSNPLVRHNDSVACATVYFLNF